MDITRKYIVRPGSPAGLKKRQPASTAGIDGKKEGERILAANLERLKELQVRLYAESRRAVLVILQAMDAGGKDGTIRRVLGPLNPQGCRVTSFKTPTAEELAHDFLWRVHKVVPRAGEIGVFNRSHYEDVLIVRVQGLAPKGVWSKRYRHINEFERLLAESGVAIVKLFLHISPDEQLDRFSKRLENPRKFWKANPQDFEERKRWDEYTVAYEDALTTCSTPHAPWYVIPADHKWYRNAVVSEILARSMDKMDLKYPAPAYDLSDFAEVAGLSADGQAASDKTKS